MLQLEQLCEYYPTLGGYPDLRGVRWQISYSSFAVSEDDYAIFEAFIIRGSSTSTVKP